MSYLCYIIFNRLDVLMLTRYTSSEDFGRVGLYSIAFRFISPLLLLPASLMVICTPWVSKMHSLDEYRGYIRSILKLTVPIGILFCLLFPFSRILIQFLADKPLPVATSAARVFNLLLPGVIFMVVTNPLTLITYAENKPWILAYADLLRLILNFIGNYILIQGKFGFPRLGIYGAALATSITAFAGGGFVLVYIYWSVFRNPSNPINP